MLQNLIQSCIFYYFSCKYHVAYTIHPYRWPTIGASVEDIQCITHDDLWQFYQNYYTTGNLVLCIAGNVTFDVPVTLVEKWFGNITTHSSVNRKYPSEPPRQQPRELTVTRNVPQDMIFVTFNMCDRMHHDFVVCDMISDLLANGMSARFTQNILTRTDIFTELDAAVEGAHDPGQFIIKGKLNTSATRQQAEELINAGWHVLVVWECELKQDLPGVVDELEKIMRYIIPVTTKS